MGVCPMQLGCFHYYYIIMSAKKQKYYVVWHGHLPGVYSTWEKCQAQVKNFPNASFKSFPSKTEAEEAYRSGPEKKSFHRTPTVARKPTVTTGIIQNSLSVDAACSGNPGLMEYRGVWTSDKTEIFHFGPAPQGTNNIGEFLAIVHALAWLEKRNDSSTPIYSDSKIAIGWIKKKKANTKLSPGKANTELFDMIRRAEKWLAEHTWKNPLLKWDTDNWGENPADFGRK